MKSIIVTGGLGFIGSNLIQVLIKKKYRVINIDKVSYSANFYNSKVFKKNKNYFFFKLDIANKDKIFKILLKFKPVAIFNLAAETHVDRSIDFPDDFIKTNILSVYNFLCSTHNYIKKTKKKIKFIHISTDEVYGDVLKGKSNENFCYNPSSPYSATKASADHIIKSFIRTYNFPAIITCSCNNYGPNQFPEKLIPKVIFNLIKKKPIIVYGKGQNSREWINVLDHCNALVAILDKGKVGNTYNIGTNQNFKNIQLVNKIINIYSKFFDKKNNSKIKFVKDRPGHDFRYSLDSEKIKKKLNWTAKISINDGLYNTIDWYLKNKLYLKPIKKILINKRYGLNK